MNEESKIFLNCHPCKRKSIIEFNCPLLVKQVNSHGESIKEIQSSLLAIHETQQQLQQQLKHSSLDGELAAAVKLLIHDYQNRMKTVNEGESSFVTGDSTDPKPRVVIDDQQPAKVFSSAYQLVNRMTKLEFPAFDGSDFKEWYYQCCQFFDLDETPEEMKIRLVAIHLNGRALHWHQSFMKDMVGRSLSWKQYVAELREQFVDGNYSKPLIELRNLKVTTTIEQFNSDFNVLRNQVELPHDLLLDLYLGGLPNEFLHTVQLLDPKSVNQAMKFAKLQESAYYALWGLEVPKSQVSTNSTPYVSSGLDRTKHTTFSPAPNTLPSPKFLPTVHPSPANTYNSKNRKSANNSYIPTHYIWPSYSPTTTNLNAKQVWRSPKATRKRSTESNSDSRLLFTLQHLLSGQGTYRAIELDDALALARMTI
ncbi:hypothetical protein Tco_1369882 [Tanacetum coccineum]